MHPATVTLLSCCDQCRMQQKQRQALIGPCAVNRCTSSCYPQVQCLGRLELAGLRARHFRSGIKRVDSHDGTVLEQTLLDGYE